MNSEQSFYVREIVRKVGSQLNAVRRELAILEKMELISVVENKKVKNSPINPRAKFFKVRVDSLIYPELKALLLKGEILKEQAMVQKLREKSGNLKLLLLTGKFVKADDVTTDILFVGKIKPIVVARILKSFEKSSNKEICYTVMSEKEFNERREIGDKFLYSILESKFLAVIDNLNLYEA